jgi:hypothetical protein
MVPHGTGGDDLHPAAGAGRALVRAGERIAAKRDVPAAFAADPMLPGMIGLLPSPHGAAFLLDVNEWPTEYKTSLV